MGNQCGYEPASQRVNGVECSTKSDIHVWMPWGGDEGTRTPNPCLAKAVLCQLSYAPGLPVRDTGHPVDGYANHRLPPAARDYRRSGAVVASCHRARSSLAVLTFLATITATPRMPATRSSFLIMR